MRSPALPLPERWPIALADRRVRAVVVLGVLAASAYLSYRPSLTLVVALYGAILVGILIRWPRLALPGLVLASAFVPFTIGTGTGSSITVAMIGLAALAALWLAEMGLQRRIHLPPSPANAPWLALCLSAGISLVAGSAMWSPWVATKSNFVVVQLAQGAIFVLSACAYWLLASDEGGRRMLRILTAILLTLGGVLIAGWLVPPLQAVSGRVLFTGPVFRIWVVALASGLALFHTELDRRVRAVLFAVATLMVAIPTLQYRDWASGWLPPLLTFGVIGTVWLWDRSRWVGLAVVAATVLGYVLYRLVIAEVAATDYWSLDTRIIAWRGLFQLLQGRWLFGLGPASYWHYWRGEIGGMSYLDPGTGYLHYTFNPTVNMHNNYMDVLGQMGLAGVAVMVWLLVALARHAKRQLHAELRGFGRAYAAASLAALGGMLFAAMLGDWIWPFVYNVGLPGFTTSFLGWMMLGGLVVLERTRETGAGYPSKTSLTAISNPSSTPSPRSTSASPSTVTSESD